MAAKDINTYGLESGNDAIPSLKGEEQVYSERLLKSKEVLIKIMDQKRISSNKKIRELEQQLQDATYQISQLKIHQRIDKVAIEEKERTANTYVNRFSHFAVRIDTLQQKIAELNRQLSESKRQVSKSERKLAESREKSAELKSKSSEVQQEHAQTQQKLKESNRLLVDTKAQLNELKKQLHIAQGNRAELDERLAQLNQDIQEIKKSYSWKLGHGIIRLIYFPIALKNKITRKR